jgi:hypothetical protein
MERSTVRHPSLLLSLLLFAAVVLGGCGEKPDPNQLDRARTALATAEAAGAPGYAPEAWQAASQAFAAAEAEFESQGKKLFGRKPAKAHELAKQAWETAETARQEGEEGMRAELAVARETMTEAETAVLSLEGALANVARCHRQKKIEELPDLLARYRVVREQFEGLEAKYDASDYDAVRLEAASLLEGAEQLMSDVEHAAWRCS